jgi:DNA (cytosine-5)-methyltransferase 1
LLRLPRLHKAPASVGAFVQAASVVAGMAERLRLLDLFCGAGGAGAGYARAGFDVVGVDIADQPSYPFEFHQADALDFPLDGFDAIHASPPCQRYSALTARWGRQGDHPDLIAVVRERLAGVPRVIENVPGAPLRDPVRLCGSSFGLDVRRHRLFETNWPLRGEPCDHPRQTPRFPVPDRRRAGRLSSVVPVYGNPNYAGDVELWRAAMGIAWMSATELREAIPPAYTEHIGRQLLEHLR